MDEEQSIQVKFNVDSSELDEAQAKAEKLVETLERVNELGKVIEKDPFSGMVFQGPPVSKEQYIKAYDSYVKRCSVEQKNVNLEVNVAAPKEASANEIADVIGAKLREKYGFNQLH